MAKATIKGLDKAIEEVYKNYKKSITKAAKEATMKAQSDIEIKAYSLLLDYYNEYPDPNSYDRTYTLSQCFVPYGKTTVKGDIISCEMGIIYDASKLEGQYEGSEIYTPTDPEWIIDNYLQGIHPRTDGSTAPGGGNYENEKLYGSSQPAWNMQTFLDGYWVVFQNNLRTSLAKQALKLTNK